MCWWVGEVLAQWGWGCFVVGMGWWRWWVSGSGVGRGGGLAGLAVGLPCSRAMPGEVRSMHPAAIPPSLVRRRRLAACGACPTATRSDLSNQPQLLSLALRPTPKRVRPNIRERWGALSLLREPPHLLCRSPPPPAGGKLRAAKVAKRKGPDGKMLSAGYGFVECSSEDVAKEVIRALQVGLNSCSLCAAALCLRFFPRRWPRKSFGRCRWGSFSCGVLVLPCIVLRLSGASQKASCFAAVASWVLGARVHGWLWLAQWGVGPEGQPGAAGGASLPDALRLQSSFLGCTSRP